MRVPLAGKKILFAAGFLSLMGAGIPLAQNESSEYAPSDTVFQEITLTVDGVSAVDTAGYDWYYDFDLGTFVVGIPGDWGEPPPPKGPDQKGEVCAPVEERNSREIKVKPVVNNIAVGYDEYVDGDVIALGRVTIKGWVKGNVTSIDSRVLIAACGRVDGDVKAPEIIVKPPGQVLGRQIVGREIGPPGSDAGMIVLVVFACFFLFFGFLVVTLMPRQTANFHTCLSENRLKAFFIGLFFMLLMPFILLLVAITIVGIVLLPLIPFVYLFAILLGVVSFGYTIGGLILAKSAGKTQGMLSRTMVGIVVFLALWFFAAALLISGSDITRGFGVFFLVLSIVVSAYPVLSGVGAAVMTRFGFKAYIPWRDRQQRAGVPLSPAPPPIPKAPPEPSPGVYDGEDENETSGPSTS